MTILYDDSKGSDRHGPPSGVTSLTRSPLGYRPLWRGLLVMMLVATIAGCGDEPEQAASEPRPVRTVTVDRRESGVPVVLTGRVEAEDEASLAFRIPGRMIERPVNLGDRVEPGQILARLEPQNELNLLRSARASLTAAEAQLVQARNHFQRQQTLSDRGFAARAVFDEAQQQLATAESQVEAADAQLKHAQDQVSFTELKADAEGVVTAIGAEPGEVVATGRMVVRLARQDGRDAVFDVPAAVIRSAPPDPEIQVSLADDSTVRAIGRVREISPQADPVTRTFQVRVGIAHPPENMRLGATVIGRMNVASGPVIELPASALTQYDRLPAVWVVDPATSTVAMRNVELQRYDPGTIVISLGVDPGEIVVTAGVQALHPGQKVRLLQVAR